MCSAAADLLYLHFVAEDVLIGVALLLCGVEAASQTVGIKQTDDRIWLVSFMDYDLGYFDDETCRLEPLANPFGPKLLPMSPE